MTSNEAECICWTSVDDARQRIRQGGTVNEPVLILGAGMAGLSAALELLEAGKAPHVHVVEARDEGGPYSPVGGRVTTHRFGPPPPSGEPDTRPYHELGAMRIPEVTHDYT